MSALPLPEINVYGHSYLIQVNWELAQSRRPRLLEVESDLPAYLLLPEVKVILHEALDGHLNLLLDTLWHSGARISEALAITPSSFHLNGAEDSDVILTTSKQRAPGRPRKGVSQPAKRLVPLADEVYLEKLHRYLATHKPRPTERIFPFTDRYYRKLLAKVIEGMSRPPLIPVTLHTFRHSFAVNLVYHGRDIRMIQRLLGHTRIESTLIYTKVLSGEVHHLMRDIQF